MENKNCKKFHSSLKSIIELINTELFVLPFDVNNIEVLTDKFEKILGDAIKNKCVNNEVIKILRKLITKLREIISKNKINNSKEVENLILESISILNL